VEVLLPPLALLVVKTPPLLPQQLGRAQQPAAALRVQALPALQQHLCRNYQVLLLRLLLVVVDQQLCQVEMEQGDLPHHHQLDSSSTRQVTPAR
jgi:hypothetical protein